MAMDFCPRHALPARGQRRARLRSALAALRAAGRCFSASTAVIGQEGEIALDRLEGREQSFGRAWSAWPWAACGGIEEDLEGGDGPGGRRPW